MKFLEYRHTRTKICFWVTLFTVLLPCCLSVTPVCFGAKPQHGLQDSGTPERINKRLTPFLHHHHSHCHEVETFSRSVENVYSFADSTASLSQPHLLSRCVYPISLFCLNIREEVSVSRWFYTRPVYSLTLSLKQPWMQIFKKNWSCISNFSK